MSNEDLLKRSDDRAEILEENDQADTARILRDLAAALRAETEAHQVTHDAMMSHIAAHEATKLDLAAARDRIARQDEAISECVRNGIADAKDLAAERKQIAEAYNFFFMLHFPNDHDLDCDVCAMIEKMRPTEGA